MTKQIPTKQKVSLNGRPAYTALRCSLPCPAPSHWTGSRKLTDIINEAHENTKYMPGCPLGPNVLACADLAETVR